MIVISDRKAVHSLLDRKGSIYSDRPRMEGASYVTGDHFTPLQPHGAEWKGRRMVVIRYFSAKMVDTRHNTLHEAEYVATCVPLEQRLVLIQVEQHASYRTL